MQFFKKNISNPIFSIKRDLTLGVDLGYGQVKITDNDKQIKFLSAVGQPLTGFARSVEVNSLPDLLKTLTVDYNNERYYIGNNAVINTRNGRLSLRQDKAAGIDTKIKLITALGLITNEDETEVDVSIVTGLPVLEFHNQRSLLTATLINENKPFKFTMHYGDKLVDKVVNVKNVKVISQSEGAFYDFILNDTGNLINQNAELVNGLVMVVDVGYRTIDIITMDNGRFVETLSDQYNKGVNQIHQELIKSIVQRFNVKLNLGDMDDIARTGSFFYNKTDNSVTKELQLISSSLAADVVDNLITISNDNLGGIRCILMTGGGSELIYDYVKEMLDSVVDVRKLSTAEYSNANGYRKYATLLRNAGGFNA